MKFSSLGATLIALGSVVTYGFIFAVFAAGQIERAPEQFEALCPNCNFHIQRTPALSIKTNRFEPIMMGSGGYTNVIIDVQLPCPNCHQTNTFESEIMTHKPRARHILRPPLPLPEQPSISLPSTNDSPTLVSVKVPPGFEVHIVPIVSTNR